MVIPDTMSLYIEPAIPTIPVDDIPLNLQQLAAFVASIAQYMPLLCYIVDLGLFLATARKHLDQVEEKLRRLKDEAKAAARSGQKRKRTTWFASIDHSLKKLRLFGSEAATSPALQVVSA